MTIGDKIKQARAMRGLTQKELGFLVNLPAFRIGQYETDVRKPKENQLIEIAKALGVPIEFFKDRSIDTITDVMHALFELDKLFGIEINTNDSRCSISFDNSTLNGFIEEWAKAKENSILSTKTKSDYEEWKITFPNSIVDDTHQQYIDIVNERMKNNKKNL